MPKNITIPWKPTPREQRSERENADLDKALDRAIAKYRLRADRGLCRRCGVRPPLEGLTACAECRERERLRGQRTRAALAATNVCKQCRKRPRIEDRTQCEACLSRTRSKRYAQQRDFEARGLCGYCGREPKDPAYDRCAPCRAAKAASQKKLRQDVLDAYGRRCACCGETEERFLTIDHVNNDGHIERKRYAKVKIHARIRRQGYPPTYQILCWNCNCGRAANGGICPHVSQRE